MSETKAPPGFLTADQLDIESLVSQSVIANQLALNYNEAIKHTNVYKSLLKPLITPLVKYLIKAEKREYDRIFEEAEEACVIQYDEFDGMVKEIAALGLHHSQNVADMLRAFRKDPASIAGIVNKINRS